MKIDIELKSLELALNPFNRNLISEDFNDYILVNCEHNILKSKEITLVIKGLKNKDDQLKLSNTIHEYYQKKNIIYNKIDSVDNYMRIILTCIGAIVILISHEFNFILSELFLIAGWVIIWEIVYDLLFNVLKRKRKNKIFNKLANSKIDFEN